MPITVDLDGVTVGGAAPLEEGIYDAVITKAEIHNSKSSQRPTLYLDLQVSYEDDEGETKERTLRWNTSVDPQGQSLGRFKQLLVRLGFEIPEGPFEFDENELIGMEVRARIGTEPHYQDPDRLQNRVRELLGTEEDAEENWG